jgi:hypothetical protein
MVFGLWKSHQRKAAKRKLQDEFPGCDWVTGAGNQFAVIRKMVLLIEALEG